MDESPAGHPPSPDDGPEAAWRRRLEEQQRTLQERLAATTTQVAETYERIAATKRRLAASGRLDPEQARYYAERAEEFARHERAHGADLLRRARGEGPGAVPGTP